MVIKRDFIYTPKGTNRTLHIYLPEGYYNSEERYPVMYFFDGHNLFYNEDATYGKSWGIREFLEGWGKDMIVVGMECSHEGQERLSEYLPYAAAKGSHFDKFAPTGDATMQWILNEVKPWVDRELRTIPFRECTAIGGSSMGGLMALYGVVHYNDWFSKGACISSAMGFCIRPLLKDLRTGPVSADTRVYLSWGSREAWGIKDPSKEDRSSKTYGWHKRVEEVLLGYGAAVKLRCQVGGGHCEADWERLVPEFMDYLWMR